MRRSAETPLRRSCQMVASKSDEDGSQRQRRTGRAEVKRRRKRSTGENGRARCGMAIFSYSAFLVS